MLYFWLKHNFLIFFSNQCSNGATRKRPTLQQSPKTAPQQEQLSNKFLCKAAGLKVLQFYKYYLATVSVEKCVLEVVY